MSFLLIWVVFTIFITQSNGQNISNNNLTESQTLLNFYHKGKIGYINKKGKVILKPIYGGYSDTFRDGYLVIATLGPVPKYGLVNHLGKFIIPPGYNKLKNLGNGIILVKNYTIKKQQKEFSNI